MLAKPLVGKYILDTLSIGMYNNPLVLFREYIQNSADAIDDAVESGDLSQDDARIDITLDGRSRSITIRDNGSGLGLQRVWRTLHDLGKSEKRSNVNRGFRGIGRLGGLGYCETLRFITKAKGEGEYSISQWDCMKLRKLISEATGSFGATDIIEKVVDFRQLRYPGKINDQFFSVEMQNVMNIRNILLHVPMVKSYLAQVAPVPFDNRQFSYSSIIEEDIRKRVPRYKSYNVFLNGCKIVKPYVNAVPVGKNIHDLISGVEFVQLGSNGSALAFGWLGKHNYLGSINTTSAIDGIRVRSGNILIGDNYTLSHLFRERRFNNYLVGELHIINPGLIPNSRRDDFEDNEYKDEFYTLFIKEIGLPFSKKIREASKQRSMSNMDRVRRDTIKKANDIAKKGHLSQTQKSMVIRSLRAISDNGGAQNIKLNDLIKKVEGSKHLLDMRGMANLNGNRGMLKNIFDTIYRKSSDKDIAESIVKSIVSKVMKK
jgi:molecular chaperone HtpG